MTTRRQFVLAGAAGVLVMSNAAAQTRPPRIGMLSAAPLDKSFLASMLLEELAERGYRRGAGMVLEYRYADRPDRYPALARELVARKCDVIFSFVSEEPARALRDAGGEVPVVLFATDYDPVQKGIVKSFARPGANITGVHTPVAAILTKWIEIAQELLPKARRFLVLGDHYTRDSVSVLRKAAEERRLQLMVVEFQQSPYDFRAALESGRREGVDGVMVLTNPEASRRRAEIGALLSSYRLPSMVGTVLSNEPGILVSYSPDVRWTVRRGVDVAVRILKGTKPADIPIEQADRYDLVLNLKTAKALGIKIPPSVMARATRLIE